MHDTEILALKALDCLSQRALITAQNVANAGTAGYRPLQIAFEEQLRLAAGEGARAIAAVEPSLSQEAFPIGQSAMRLDIELATATTTAGRYAALVEILNRNLQLGSLALSGDR